MVAFPCKIGAPVTGITLSTRVGRLSRTHFELWFSVNAIVSLGRKVTEPQGGRVGDKQYGLTVFSVALKAAAKLLQICGGKPVSGW